MKHSTISKKNKPRRNYTSRKKGNLSIKTLPIKFKLYASKSYDGQAILDHAHELQQKYHNTCITENLTWLGSYNVAKKYKTSDTNIYEWAVKTPTRLLIINKINKTHLNKLFLTTRKTLTTLLGLSTINKDKLMKSADNEGFTHPYFTMSNNEQAWHEFAFAYGYLSLTEQYHFLQLIKFLLSNKFVSINMRNGDSIMTKINRDMYYYRSVIMLPYKHKETYNRISFYQFDKSVLTNLCSLLPHTISGVYQPNENSFWFPDLMIYQMNIEEYVLFNPYRNLKYIKEMV